MLYGKSSAALAEAAAKTALSITATGHTGRRRADILVQSKQRPSSTVEQVFVIFPLTETRLSGLNQRGYEKL